MTSAYIGLGSNVGRSLYYLKQANRRLARIPNTRLTAFSPVYRSAPIGCPGVQKYYYNAAARLQSRLSPHRLHRYLRQLEMNIQKRSRKKNAPRRLDVDYLLHGYAKLQRPQLILPHPRLYYRAFALKPLLDIFVKTHFNHHHYFDFIRALSFCENQKIHRVP